MTAFFGTLLCLSPIFVRFLSVNVYCPWKHLGRRFLFLSVRLFMSCNCSKCSIDHLSFSLCLPTYLPIYLPTYLPTYLVQSISSCESDFLHVCPLLWINISALGTPFYPFQDIKRWQVLKWSSFTARVVTAKAVKINQDTPYRSLASKGKFGRVHFWRIVLWSYFIAHLTCKCVLKVHSWTVVFLRYCEENKSLWTFVERFC